MLQKHLLLTRRRQAQVWLLQHQLLLRSGSSEWSSLTHSRRSYPPLKAPSAVGSFSFASNNLNCAVVQVQPHPFGPEKSDFVAAVIVLARLMLTVRS